MSLLSSSFFIVWFLMEVGVLSFIIILLSSTTSNSYSCVVKYFLFQAIASILLFITFLLEKYTMLLVPVILIIKIGIAPFHLWFIIIINKINILNLIWVSVIQKLVPLRLFIFVRYVELLSHIVVIRLRLASLNIIVQTKFNKIIGASSVYSSSWLVVRVIIVERLTWGFILIYAFAQTNLVIFYNWIKISPIKSLFRQSYYIGLLIISFILILGGFPPSPLFFMKLILIQESVSQNITLLVMSLVVNARIVIFSYLNLILIFFSSSLRKNN
jgi:NADH-ubiquinone oxidoreductase chain 2